MKRTVGLAGMGLVLISVALAGCAPMQKTMITSNNLSVLKGTWEGWTTFGIGGGKGVLTQLVIKNDTLPVQGSVTFNNLSSELALTIPADHKTAGNNVTINFSEGRISNDGTVIAQAGKDSLELTYFAGEKPTIKGQFWYWALKGTFDVTRK